MHRAPLGDPALHPVAILIIEAVPPRSLLALLQTLQPINEEFPQVSDEPPGEVNI